MYQQNGNANEGAPIENGDHALPVQNEAPVEDGNPGVPVQNGAAVLNGPIGWWCWKR